MRKRQTDLALLLPVVRPQFEKLREMLDHGHANKKLSVMLKPFETWRSPDRQNELYAQGRTMMGRRVTNAKAWESPHQYGLAVDWVGWIRQPGVESMSAKWVWSWDAPTKEDWAFLASCATQCGLRAPIPWDLPHVESNLIDDFRTIIEWREGKAPI